MTMVGVGRVAAVAHAILLGLVLAVVSVEVVDVLAMAILVGFAAAAEVEAAEVVQGMVA